MKFLVFYFAGLASLILFLKGFFPVKFSPAKYSTYDDVHTPQQIFDDPNVESKGYSYEPPVKKLVWIVVDAMRFDFIADEKYRDRMPFLKQALGSGQAKLYKAMAKAPTVTMPRIKALTSGSITGFVDVLLNMNQSPKFKYDNIIYQLRVTGGKQMVFYGDDTWLRLFPNTFKRHDGTTSFYVNDYTEVDNNVTRHLDSELDRRDWDVMILHYLGLDHIGHLSGPTSLLMNPKLSEMDSVIHKISKKFLATENHLVILTSDHGMSGSGSHGGTTSSEITTPLVLIRPPSEKKHTTKEGYPWEKNVEQTDIAASISLAMGVPIPSTSMGKTITGFIQNMNGTSQLSALQYNCFQLLQHLNTSAPGNVEFASHCYKQSLAAHSAFVTGKRGGSNGFNVAKSMYKSCQREISKELTSHVSNYNYPVIYMGLLCMFLSASILTAMWFFDLCRAPRFSHTDQLMTSSTLKKFSLVLLLGTVMDVGMMGGSSFVEEQHQTWQFLTSTMALALFFGFLRVVYTSSGDVSSGASVQATTSSLRQVAVESVAKLRKSDKSGSGSPSFGGLKLKRKSGKLWQQLWLFLAFLALVCHRAMKPWNQTGIKYIDTPDIGDWLNLPQNNSLLSLISIVSLFGCALLCDFIVCTSSDRIRSFLTWVGYFCIYNYRHATRSFMLYGSDQDSLLMAAYEARIVYLIIGALLAKSLAFHASYWFNQKPAASSSQQHVLSVPSCYYDIGSREKGCDCATSAVLLLSALLLRPHNHVILALNIFLYVILMKILWPVLVEGKEELLKSYLFKSDYKAASGFCDEMSPLQGCARIVLAYWFGQHAYFILGNSNGFATIDLSAAYVGLSSSDGLSNTIISILLGVFATYIGPIVWMTLTLTEMIKTCDSEMSMNRSSKFSTSSFVLSTMAVIRILTVAFYLTIVFGHRYHLFIWSVFAPKLLYELVSTSVFALILTLAFVFWR